MSSLNIISSSSIKKMHAPTFLHGCDVHLAHEGGGEAVVVGGGGGDRAVLSPLQWIPDGRRQLIILPLAKMPQSASTNFKERINLQLCISSSSSLINRQTKARVRSFFSRGGIADCFNFFVLFPLLPLFWRRPRQIKLGKLGYTT